ncbi:MAG: tetratricopeptide repeat protein [Deltaproteobacteria bacterium]
MNKNYKYFIIILLIMTSLIAFGRIIGNDFINFDDGAYITENNHIKAGLTSETIKWAFSAVVSSNWHPLTLLSHALDWSLFGANAGGHHLVSLLWHIGSAILLFLFLSKTTGSLWPSAFVAALFALHPLRVESVAWAAERKDVLSVFFGMATLYTYLLYTEKLQFPKYILCILLFVLSLLAKPTLVTLPFVLMLIDYWPLGRWQKVSALANAVVPVNVLGFGKKKSKNRKRGSSAEKRNTAPLSTTKNSEHLTAQLFWEKIPFLFLAVASSIATIWAQNKGGAIASLQKVQFTERLANAIISYIAYLGKIIWPVDLAVFYPYEYSAPGWQIIACLILLVAISAFAIFYIKKAAFIFVGWFWYLGTLVPVIGFIQVGRQAMADRYTYFPSIGITVILACGIIHLWPEEKLRKVIIIPAAIIIAALTFLTWQQCGYWENSSTLFNHTLQVTKNNYLAHTNLGVALLAEGKTQEAISHYRAALQIKPSDDNTHYNLANALKRQGAIDEAIVHYREAVKWNPNYSKAHNNLGVCLEALGLRDEAIIHYRQALQIEPANPGFHFNLGMTMGRKGDSKEAIECFRTAIYLNPDYEEARRALRVAQEIKKR